MKYDLSNYDISELKRKLGNKKIIFIDESSFIGINSICLIDNSLRKVGNKDLPFGGYQIIYTGDILQLKTVGDVEI